MRLAFIHVLLMLGFLLALPAASLAAEREQSQPATIAADVRAISGYWYTENREGIVKLYPCANEICGSFYWLSDDEGGPAVRDTKNPDTDKQQRPLCGLQFMGGFTPIGAAHFTGGWIYSPRHGAMFSATMTLQDKNTLDLHGYMLTPVLGQSQIWHRVTQLPAACKPPPEAAPAVRSHRYPQSTNQSR